MKFQFNTEPNFWSFKNAKAIFKHRILGFQGAASH
jgi:hypothetical protein